MNQIGLGFIASIGQLMFGATGAGLLWAAFETSDKWMFVLGLLVGSAYCIAFVMGCYVIGDAIEHSKEARQ